jgi:hypothetical protein
MFQNQVTEVNQCLEYHIILKNKHTQSKRIQLLRTAYWKETSGPEITFQDQKTSEDITDE